MKRERVTQELVQHVANLPLVARALSAAGHG
jgi:hypothetical protein